MREEGFSPKPPPDASDGKRDVQVVDSVSNGLTEGSSVRMKQDRCVSRLPLSSPFLSLCPV